MRLLLLTAESEIDDTAGGKSPRRSRRDVTTVQQRAKHRQL